MEEILQFISTDIIGHPTVQSHTYPDGTSTSTAPQNTADFTWATDHSMYYFEDYFSGFVTGMSTSYPETITAPTGTAGGATYTTCYDTKD